MRATYVQAENYTEQAMVLCFLKFSIWKVFTYTEEIKQRKKKKDTENSMAIVRGNWVGGNGR